MKKNSKKLTEIYNRLYSHFGPQHWWPGDSPIEIAIGAILTQNTAWSNVEKAINNLKKEKLLNVSSLLKVPKRKLARLIKPAGYFNIKADRLQHFFKYLKKEKCDNQLKSLRRYPTSKLRKDLLDVKGIGPETADSILLYALNRPVFVVDAYTKRVLGRHGLMPDGAGYEEIRQFFEGSLKKSAPLYNEYHALIVRLAKEHCKTKPRCQECPLKCFFRGKIPKFVP